jgi:hypothetical protein
MNLNANILCIKQASKLNIEHKVKRDYFIFKKNLFKLPKIIQKSL